jgi:hypothetical protein
VSAASSVGSALWGLALLAAFVGWGRWIAKSLRLRERTHFGLELAWGFAATLAMGGWLCWLGVAVRPVLATWVALGLSGWLVRGARTGAAPVADAPGLRVGFALLCAVLLGLGYATGLLDPRYKGPDDHTAYFLHARQILETGTLLEPFSFRRMASYGGQSFLHALVLVVAPVGQLNLLDKGICRVAVGVALLGHVLARPSRSLLAAAAVVYVAIAYQDIALNTSSIFSGALAFAGLWMTLEACRSDPSRPIANGALTGLAIAATLPLRQNYLLACAAMVLLEHASRLRAGRDRRQAQELLAAGAGAALCAGGWALLQLESSGTPLYPLLRGFANPAWSGVLSAHSLAELVDAAGKFVGWPILAVQLVVAVLALATVDRSPRTTSLAPLATSALIAFAAHCWFLAHVHPEDLARYSAAFLLPTALFASARSVEALVQVRGLGALRERRVWLPSLQLLLLLLLLPPWSRLPERVRVLGAEIAILPRVPDPAARARRLERLQRAAPAGERLLVMVDDPHLLDLRRNEVASLDLPGAVGPPPGPWAIETPRGLVGYLRRLGYTWLAAARPERAPHWSPYARGRWDEHANGVPQQWQYDAASVRAWQVMGRTVVRFFDQLDAITASCALGYDDGREVMIDLSRCHFEAPTS